MNATTTPAAAAELGITVQGVRYVATRQDGRYRVLDQDNGFAPVGGASPSRAKAEEKAAKLNRQEELGAKAADTEQAAEDAVSSVYAKFAATREARAEARAEAEAIAAQAEAEYDAEFGDEPLLTAQEAAEAFAAPLEVVTLDGEETSVEVTATPVTAEAVRTSPVFAKLSEEAREQIARNAAEVAAHAETAPAKKAAKKAAKAEKPAAEAGAKTLWIAPAVTPLILADTAPERASLVAKLAAATPDARDYRRPRLSPEEGTELAAIATEIETAALEAGDGRLAASAAGMRNRLAALWA